MSKIEINTDCSTQEILNQLDKIKLMVIEREAKESEKSKYDKAEKLFLELINQGLVMKVKDGKVTHYDKNGEWVIEQDKESKFFWFSYGIFWVKIEPIFDNNYQEINVFLNGMLDKHLGLSGYTSKFIFKHKLYVE